METKKKYELTNKTIEFNGITLHRIKALKDFSNVKAGDFGGWVEKENNLSQIGNAWIGGDAKVYGMAKVYGDAQVYGNAIVSDNARVYGDARVCQGASVCGNAMVCGDAMVRCGADYIIFKNFWSSGRFFTWTRSNNIWKVGCFYGTGEELIEKAYKDSAKSGKEYEKIVRYVDSILADK